MMFFIYSILEGAYYSGTKLLKKSHILKFINDFFLLLNRNELTLQRMERNNIANKGLSILTQQQ
jgi:hypothetical protein